ARIFFGSQQLLDQLAPLVGRRVGKECASLVDRRDTAGQVQVHAAEEAGIVYHAGRLVLAGLRDDQLIDLPAKRLFGRCRGGRYCQNTNTSQGHATSSQIEHRGTPEGGRRFSGGTTEAGRTLHPSLGYTGNFNRILPK